MTIGLHRYAICLTLITLLAVFAAIGAARADETRFADTYISKLAASVKPGEFVPFEPGLAPGGERFSQLLRGQRPDGSSAPAIDTWTDSAYWDPQRKRAFFQGLRQSNRFLTYDAVANAWSELSLDVPNAPPLFQRFGHLYGRTALDWKRGHFYRINGSTLHRYVIDEDRWEAFEGSPIGGYIPIDWHYGLDMLVGVSKGALHGFRAGVWTSLGETAVDGYHSSAKYNPVRRDMLFIGGNHSRRTVDILTAAGTILHMGEAPFGFGISQDNLTHDPISGNYLVLHRDRILWEYNPDRDEWRVARDMSGEGAGWPFDRHGGIVPIVIDELGVILWNHGSAARLHRHRSIFSPEENKSATATAPSSRARPAAPAKALPAPSKPTRSAAPAASTPPRPGITATRPGRAPAPGIIEREASSMQPGEWRNIAHLTTWPGKDEGHSFKGFQYLKGIDGAPGGADGMGWTQNLVYHEGRLMMLLMRDQLERALMAMEPDGRFWRINQPEGFDQKGHRRPFNKLTQDDTYLYYSPNIGRSNLGRMIRTPLDNPGVFEDFGIPIGDTQILGQFAATYVPEWKRFYAYTPGGKVWSWSEGESAWHFHGRTPITDGARASGYAGVLLWNPVLGELVIMGGQSFGSSPIAGHKVARITHPRGDIEALPDMKKPDQSNLVYNSAQNKLIIDPRDGSYLQLDRTGIIYKNCSPGGVWSVYEDIREAKPLGQYELYAPYAFIPGTDVIVFLSHIRGLVLHRLKPISGPPCVRPPVPSAPKPNPTADAAPQQRPTLAPQVAAPPQTAPKPSTPPSTPSPPTWQRAPEAPTPAPPTQVDPLSSSAIRAARSKAAGSLQPPAPDTSSAAPASVAAELGASTIRAIRPHQ